MATQAITAGSLTDNDMATVRTGGSTNTKFDSQVALGGNLTNFNLIGGAPTANRGFQSLAGGVPGEVTDYVKLIDVTVGDQMNDQMNGAFTNTQQQNNSAVTIGAYSSFVDSNWVYAYTSELYPTSPVSYGTVDNVTSTFHNIISNLSSAISGMYNPSYCFKAGALPTVGNKS